MTKPDWGHGPNTPVVMFTEHEIRTAWVRHQLADVGTSSPDSLSDSRIEAADQFIAVLRQVRGT
jgi:hypothetical protein